MAEITFKRTTAGLGAVGYSHFRISYGERGHEVWADLPFTDDEASFTLPDGLTDFVLKCQMLGDRAGSVAVEAKAGGKVLKPGFSRVIKAKDAGKTLVIYQGVNL